MSLLQELDAKNTYPNGEGFMLLTQPSELETDPTQDDPDLTALKIALQDRANAETWIQTQGWLLQWQREERLYLFKVPVRTWDGTNIPRSHLGMPLVYEHVESVLPQLMSALFANDPPFTSKPLPNTNMETARANDALLGWQLNKMNAREEFRLGLKYMLLHGIGIWKIGWQSYTTKRKVYVRTKPYEWTTVPQGHRVMRVNPKGNSKKAIDIEVEVNEPTFEHKNIKHILVDPGLQGPDIRKAKFVIDLRYMTPLQLDELRDYEGYKIPSLEDLIKLKFPDGGEETPRQNPLERPELNLFQEFQPQPRHWNSTVDKRAQPLEVMEYWTKDRVYTILQSKTIIRNEPNPFGVIPFFSVAQADVLGSFFGVGFGMLIGNEQRMQQGVINTFLDDLSLSLNGMFQRVRGTNVLTQQLRMRPGGIIDSDTAEGVSIMKRNPIPIAETQAVLAASDSRAARRTAANESAVQGAMPSDKSSITRTATGVNSLASGSGTRLQAIVEQFAYQVFQPMLTTMHKMNGVYLEPEDISRILSNELGISYQGDTLELINGQFDFTMTAGSRLQSRTSMKQSLPLFYQFLLTQPVLEAVQQQQKKVNILELVKMTFDTSGWPSDSTYDSLIIPMTQEDIQRAQQEQQAPAQAQAAQMQHDAQMESIKTENKGQLLDRSSVDKAGELFFKHVFEHDDETATGDK
jgi:hypothetical protein